MRSSNTRRSARTIGYGTWLMMSISGCEEGGDAGPTETGAESATEPEACEPSEYAPVPDGARGVPIDFEVGYAVQELGDNLHWVTNGTDQVIFLVTGEGVILVDAPPSMIDAITAAVAGVTDEPITHVVYSHYHADHIAGATAVAPGATFVGHAETAAQLARADDPARPIPTITFDDTYVLELGDQVLELEYHGPNHVDGNISIRAPAQGVLMMVDVVWPGWVPFTHLGQAEDVPGYIDVFDELLAMPFDVFVGGHVGRPGTRADVEDVQEYVHEVRDNAGAALATVSFDAIAQEVGYENTWLLVDRYFDAIATECAATTTPAWVDRLGGADVWTKPNCFAMFQSLRID